MPLPNSSLALSNVRNTGNRNTQKLVLAETQILKNQVKNIARSIFCF